MDKQPYIVGVGAANADLNGASLAPIHLRDSNPCVKTSPDWARMSSF